MDHVLLDHQERQPEALQDAADVAADAAVADDDHVPLDGLGERFRRRPAAIHPSPQPGHAAQRPLHGRDEVEHKRVDDDGDDRRGQDQAILVGV